MEKPLTDSQSKANLFGTRADKANQIMSQLANDKNNPTDRPGLIKRTAEGTAGMLPFVGDGMAAAAGSATNWTQSAPQQQVEQAQRDFVNAVLRRESGAVISPGEFENAKTQYFPAIGDSPEVIKQKANNRQTAIQGIMSEVPKRSSFGKKSTGGASGGWDITKVD